MEQQIERILIDIEITYLQQDYYTYLYKEREHVFNDIWASRKGNKICIDDKIGNITARLEDAESITIRGKEYSFHHKRMIEGISQVYLIAK